MRTTWESEGTVTRATMAFAQSKINSNIQTRYSAALEKLSSLTIDLAKSDLKPGERERLIKEIKENNNPCDPRDPRDPLRCDQYRFG